MTIVTIAASVFMVEFLIAIAVHVIRFYRKQRRFFAHLDAQFYADLTALSIEFAVAMIAEHSVATPAEDMQFAPPDWDLKR